MLLNVFKYQRELVNAMCQPDGTARHPGTWLNTILSVWRRMFLDEIIFQIRRLSKAVDLPVVASSSASQV